MFLNATTTALPSVTATTTTSTAQHSNMFPTAVNFQQLNFLKSLQQPSGPMSWSRMNTSPPPSSSQQLTRTGDDDDHLSRHLDNVNNDELIVEEREEFNDAKLAKLMGGVKLAGGCSGEVPSSSVAKEEDEDEYLLVANDAGGIPNDEQPKVFQDEDVEGGVAVVVVGPDPPVLLMAQQQRLKMGGQVVVGDAGSNLIAFKSILAAAANTKANSSSVLLNNVHTAKTTPLASEPSTLAANTTTTTTTSASMASVLPTPLAYSRSSSVTSLNSCLADDDLKSVHSSVASEYSHHHHRKHSRGHTTRTRPPAANPSRDADKALSDHSQSLLDESASAANTTTATNNNNLHVGDCSLLTDIVPPESPVACDRDSSFLVSQRIKHKEQQLHCRQKAVKAIIASSELMADAAAANGVVHFDGEKATTTPVTFAAHQTEYAVNSQPSMRPLAAGPNMKPMPPSSVLPSSYQVTNTPPVKLPPQSAANPLPKFLSSLGTTVNPAHLLANQPIISHPSHMHSGYNQNCFAAAAAVAVAASVPTVSSSTTTTATNSNGTAPMSVTYGFMKNSTFSAQQTTSSFSATQMHHQPTHHANPPNPTVFNMAPVGAQQKSMPKFLVTNNASLMMNQMSQMGYGSGQQPAMYPSQAMGGVVGVPVRSMQMQLPIHQQQQQQQQLHQQHQSSSVQKVSIPDVDESNVYHEDDNDGYSEDTCRVYATENRFKPGAPLSTNYGCHQQLSHLMGGNSSPPESVCSRMSEVSLPSVIRQDIGKTNLSVGLNNNNNSGGNKPHDEFRELFSRLNGGHVAPRSNPVPENNNNSNNMRQLCHDPSSFNQNANRMGDINRGVHRPMPHFATNLTKPTAALIDQNDDNDDYDDDDQPKQFFTEDTTNDHINEQSSSSSASSNSSIVRNTNNYHDTADLDDDLEMFIKENFQPSTTTTTTTTKTSLANRRSNTSLNEYDLHRASTTTTGGDASVPFSVRHPRNNTNSQRNFKRASLHSLDSLPLSATATTSTSTASSVKAAVVTRLTAKATSSKASSVVGNSSLRPAKATPATATIVPKTTSTSTAMKSVASAMRPITMTKTAQLRAASNSAAATVVDKTAKKSTMAMNASVCVTKQQPAPVKSSASPMKQTGMASSARRKSLIVGVAATSGGGSRPGVATTTAGNAGVSSVAAKKTVTQATGATTKPAVFGGGGGGRAVGPSSGAGLKSVASANKLKQIFK